MAEEVRLSSEMSSSEADRGSQGAGGSVCGPVACCGKKRRKMTVRERMFLTPWEKWVQFGRAPTKLVLNLVLVILTSTQIILYNAQESGLYANATAAFGYWFMPQGYDLSPLPWQLFTQNDTVAAVRSAVDAYYSLNAQSLDVYLYSCRRTAMGPNGTVPQGAVESYCTNSSFAVAPVLTVTRYENVAPLYSASGAARVGEEGEASDRVLVSETPLGPGSVGPLATQDENWWASLITVDLSFPLHTVVPGGLMRACVSWWLDVRYDLTARSAVNVWIYPSPEGLCELGDVQPRSGGSDALNATILLVAIWLGVLHVRAIFRSVRLTARVHRWASEHLHELSRTPSLRVMLDAEHDDDDEDDGEGSPRKREASAEGSPVAAGAGGGGSSASLSSATGAHLHLPAWEELNCWERVKVVSPWYIAGLVAAVLNAVTAIALLVLRGLYPWGPSALAVAQGLGCALQWVSLIRFVEHDQSFFGVVLTLRHAAPRVARFLLGVLPLFFAYDVFAVAVFSSRVPRFQTFGQAAVTLFAIANGDVVRESFVALEANYPVIGQIYMYSFVCLFIYVVLNCTIAIVEESFFSTAQRAEELRKLQEQLRESLYRHSHEHDHDHDDHSSDAGGDARAPLRSSGSKLGLGLGGAHDAGDDDRDEETSAAATEAAYRIVAQAAAQSHSLMPKGDSHMARLHFRATHKDFSDKARIDTIFAAAELDEMTRHAASAAAPSAAPGSSSAAAPPTQRSAAYAAPSSAT